MRLVTRSDFDGLICAVLLKEAGVIDHYKFVHPKDIQDGIVPISENDVLTNIPYWPGCGLWFDHHSSEDDVTSLFAADFKGASRPEKSCARIVYDYFGGKKKFKKFAKMIEAVDKSDSGDLTSEEIKNPSGWILLSFIMDPRTGLGKYKDYRISNYQLMQDLIEYCRTLPIEEILAHPDVQERISRYRTDQEHYIDMLKGCSKLYGSCLVIDLRPVKTTPAGNRFIEYMLFPECNVSMRVIWGLTKNIVVLCMGHSILNKSCTIDVGNIAKQYGGGGHFKVATCQIPESNADDILDEVIDYMVKHGPPATVQ
ncbi:MAG: exopolyphosphatase [Candidatus Eremiobacteraeota bacterium]|nr:exopolyphosphatase [Candidatus Eremiobacteraeota bacterium]